LQIYIAGIDNLSKNLDETTTMRSVVIVKKLLGKTVVTRLPVVSRCSPTNSKNDIEEKENAMAKLLKNKLEKVNR
jgi:hypothetical protein